MPNRISFHVLIRQRGVTVLMAEDVVALIEEVAPWQEEALVVEKISSTGSKLIANGEDCLKGCDGADGGEVMGGGVVLGVVKRWLSKIPGEVIGERGGDTIGLDGGAV
uniref:Uncharacterized protein n=1 Tax=Tanacetum cinerariifolium TaxID=118510 RepID=A0A699K1L8_TANCI|nr:hypothetical protein [Tanacetum cinerariifolium]